MIDHDNTLQANLASFIQYTVVRWESIVYLNYCNFVFHVPLLIRQGRGTQGTDHLSARLAVLSLLCYGHVQIVCMEPEEVPEDNTDAYRTCTHYGMLDSTRSLFRDLHYFRTSSTYALLGYIHI